MEWMTIILAGIAGTSVMTLFSYICQLISHKKLGEPKLLSQFLQKSRMEIGKKSRMTFWGWVLHYGTGIIFSLLMALIIYFFEVPLTWGTAALMGFTLGLLGIAGWQVLYWLHHDPPAMDRPAFYLQLVVAHIFFGIGAISIFKFWPW